MNNEIKIVAGVGLAAGTVVGVYTINKQKLKVDDERNKNMFKGHDIDKVREKMEAVTVVADNNMDGTYPNCYDGLSDKAIRSIAPDDIEEHKIVPSLSPIEKEKISNMVAGMSEEEMKITLQNIPMTLIFDHITGVLEKNRQFAQSVQDAMKKLQE